METKCLHELMPLTGQAQQWADVCVYGVSSDSRQVKQGDLFITCLGEPKRLRCYVKQAQERGAVAVVIDAQQAFKLASSGLTVPIISLPNLISMQGLIAAHINHDPSQHMSLIGITGTNGKTSCSQFIAQCFSDLGLTCGVVGTLGYGLLDTLVQGPNTTPDEVTMQSQLGAMAQAGAVACAIEVSSHGLAQGRLNGCRFETAVFTNLTQDHLDYHGDFGSYAEAKASLFRSPGLKNAVINIDDNVGKRILADLDPSIRGVSFSLENITADIHCQSIHLHPDGVHAVIQTPWGFGEVKSSLLGKFNLSNLLAVIGAVALHEGDLGHQNFQKILTLVPKLKAVIGRMELVSDSTGLAVIVDYAHTPDALEKALQALRLHCEGKLWVVFGCGGDRDTGKRPAMGAIAVKYADQVIVTSDNPRTESPHQIIDQIIENIKGQCSIESDRRAAINHAVLNAKPGDVVLIAGKGHENYQILGADQLVFSDQKEARLALDKRLPLREIGGDS